MTDDTATPHLALLPPDHPQRLALNEELHSRPPATLEGSGRATYLALLVDPAERAREFDHLVALCRQSGVTPPDKGVAQFSTQIGAVRLQWEVHGEFSGLTLFASGLSAEPYSEPVASLMPEGWLAGLPGRTLVAAHAKVIADPRFTVDAALLEQHFGANQVVGAEVGDGAGAVYTDFRLHAGGYSRFLLVNRNFTPRQAGRMLQRLFEIEAYRCLSLLALPLARRKAPQLEAIEQALARLTAQIAQGDQADHILLPELTALAAGVEREIAENQFRFDACKAYRAIVRTRIEELRESRLPGLQTIEEFMNRRFTPAVARVETVNRRLRALSERVARASALLSTRVDIAREHQNQSLLASMDRRAHQQLRLQQTVEGLSVAAISYYAAGLVGYAAKGGKALGLPVQPDALVAISLPVIFILVMLALRRAHRALHDLGD